MQTRELSLKELEIVHEFIKNFIELDYESFEDRIYELRHNDYKMLGMFHNDEVIAYAGVNIMSTLSRPRSLNVYELFVKEEFIERGFDDEMILYLRDYAKMNQCTALHVEVEKLSRNYYKLLKDKNFIKSDSTFFTSSI